MGRPARRARKNKPNIQEQQGTSSANNPPPKMDQSASPIKNNNNVTKTKIIPMKKRPYLPLPIRNKIEEMGGSGLVFVGEKYLTLINIRPINSSFRILKSQIENEFLNIDEKGNLKMGIDVKLLICNYDYQPGSENDDQVKDVVLKRWPAGKSYMYAFFKNWNCIPQEHDLQEGMQVQLWAFRVQNQLNIALVKLQNNRRCR